MRKTRKWYKEHYLQCKELLDTAKEHLEYSNYGTTWERECSVGLRSALKQFYDDLEKEKENEIMKGGD